MINYFSFFLLGHLLGDFVLQPDIIAEYKDKKKCSIKKIISLIVHIASLFGINLLLFYIFTNIFTSVIELRVVLKINWVLLIIHLAIDLIKPYLGLCIEIIEVKFKNLYLYLFDQFLHILSIYFVLCFFLPRNFGIIFQLKKLENFDFLNETKTYWILIIFIMATFFGAYFIKLFLLGMNLQPKKSKILLGTNLQSKRSNKNTNDETTLLGVGKIIGLLERGLIIVLVSVDSYPGVATVIALKSLARFKNIENDQDFAEYYLVGNILSLTFSIFGGLLIKILIAQ